MSFLTTSVQHYPGHSTQCNKEKVTYFIHTHKGWRGRSKTIRIYRQCGHEAVSVENLTKLQKMLLKLQVNLTGFQDITSIYTGQLYFCILGMSGLVAQLCPTLCNPTDHSPPGSSVHGILQARTLEWVAISFSRY